MKRAFLFIFMLLGISSGCEASAHTLSFKLYRGYLIVAKCSVSSQPDLTAIIDTGTTETVLDTQIVNRLSLKTWADSTTSLTEDSAAQGVSIPNLQLGPLQMTELKGITIDLSSLGKKLRVHPDVVIGMDVLHRMNFIIDYKSQLITFGSSPNLSHSAVLAPGSRSVLIDSSVLGKSMRLKVDTGFNSLLLYGNRITGLAHPVDTGARIDGVAQLSIVRSIESLQVRVGDWCSLHMMVSVIDGAPHNFSEFDGLLGPRLLGARRLSFDFDHQMLYWD